MEGKKNKKDETVKKELSKLRSRINHKSKKVYLKTMLPVMNLFHQNEIEKFKMEMDTEIDKLIAGDIRLSGLKFQREKMWKEAELSATHMVAPVGISPLNVQELFQRYFDKQADYIKRWL